MAYPYNSYQPPQSAFPYQPTNYLPQQQNVAQSQQTAPQSFSVRPVASREEAMAIPSEFFGPGVLMPCLGQGTIFLKRFNTNTGSSDLLEFVYVQPQKKVEAEFVPMNLFQQLVQEVEQLKKGGTVNESHE